MSQSNKISAHVWVCVCVFVVVFFVFHCHITLQFPGTWRDEIWPDNWTAVTQVCSCLSCMHIFILRILSSFLFYLAEAWSVSRFPFTPLHFELKLNVASCSRFCGFAHQFSYYLPKLAQISQPVRSEASRCLLARTFPRFPPVTEISCELWLVLCAGYFSCDWLRSQLLLARLQSTLKLSQKQNRNFVFSL